MFLTIFISPSVAFSYADMDMTVQNDRNYVPLDHSIAKASHVDLNSKDSIFNISPSQSLKIGVKIWDNECGGTISGLTSWNYGRSMPPSGGS